MDEVWTEPEVWIIGIVETDEGGEHFRSVAHADNRKSAYRLAELVGKFYPHLRKPEVRQLPSADGIV